MAEFAPLRVLICGGRKFSNRALIEALISTFPRDTVIIEGEAPGADTIARACARTAGLKVEAYPADWRRHGRAAGPIRNKQMLVEGKPDIVYAFPDCPLEESKGTADMVRQATKAGIHVEVIEFKG